MRILPNLVAYNAAISASAYHSSTESSRTLRRTDRNTLFEQGLECLEPKVLDYLGHTQYLEIFGMVI